jgi:hypothetical protein
MTFVKSSHQQPLEHTNYVTCLTKINKSLNEEKAVQMLVIGTEHGGLLFMDPSGLLIKRELKLPSTPVQLISEG